ncbi:MAG: CBS domain-containing protein [Pseudomonadota bacterium]
MSDYKPLSVQYLSGAVRVSQPASPKPVTLESSACEVMTDLRYVSAAVISPDTPMEIANTYMMQRGIRSLFVMNQDNTLGGIITATDILGEKPLRFIQERRIRHNEILVLDMMTPLDKLEAIPVGEVEHAKVGNIVASLRESGRLHTLVIENQIDSLPKICGIFSWTQIEKQLGAVIMPTNVAKSFAEIETTLIGG